MPNAPYTYRGLIVEYWDLLRGDTSRWSSRPYFLDLIRKSGQPVLDVACGTGRLLLDYAAEGIDIDGVDISPEMIDLCRANAREAGLGPHLYVQAMQELDLPRRYQTILVPSSSFLHLTRPADALEALRRFRTHLLPGGLLSMSLRIFEPDPAAAEWDLDGEAARPDGSIVRRWFRCTYDVPRRLQNTDYRYEIINDGQTVASERYTMDADLTWYPLGDALDLLSEAGFVNVHAQSDFTEEPATDEDTSFIVLGTKSPDASR